MNGSRWSRMPYEEREQRLIGAVACLLGIVIAVFGVAIRHHGIIGSAVGCVASGAFLLHGPYLNRNRSVK